MKLRLFPFTTAQLFTAPLLIAALFALSCGEDSTKTETETDGPPASTDNGSTDSSPGASGGRRRLGNRHGKPHL